ncbi:MAG: polysaccharide deacetylase family protein [Terracidiphilus sp.]
MDVYPHPYTVQQYGYHPNEVALTFDDSPDPEWTPKILDILKAKHVKGTFMAIGSQAAEHIGLMQRIVREGNEIGNHTWTHPDISLISPRQVDLEITLTERLFESKLGVQPLYFRPPYDIDEEPDTDDEAEPAWRIQQMGYTIIGSKIDTDDWDEHPRKSAQEIIQSVFAQLETMKSKPQFRGSIVLMHDGGGDRSVTVASLGPLIDALRAPRLHHRSRLRAHGQDDSRSHAAAHLLAAHAHHPRFHRLLRARHYRQLHRHGLLRRRRAHERAPHHRWTVRGHRPLSQAFSHGLARLQPTRRRSHPRLQRRDRHRPHHSLRAQLRLHQPPRHRYR